jgi:Fe-S-cluster containining protein
MDWESEREAASGNEGAARGCKNDDCDESYEGYNNTEDDDRGAAMSEPWYKDGLRFTCTMCGHCCTGEPGFVWVNEDDLAAIASFRGENREEVVARFTKMGHRGRTLREKLNGDCVFYDREKGCTVYPARPPQCRTWPFWESNVVTPDAWKQTCDVCPGSGQGALIPAEEITQRLNVIKL